MKNVILKFYTVTQYQFSFKTAIIKSSGIENKETSISKLIENIICCLLETLQIFASLQSDELVHQVVSKVLSVLISFVLQPYILINICSAVSWYIPIDREFCTLYMDAVHFFHILIFCLFSVYYYIISLSDFRPIFLHKFKFNLSAAETDRKINRELGNGS